MNVEQIQTVDICIKNTIRAAEYLVKMEVANMTNMTAQYSNLKRESLTTAKYAKSCIDGTKKMNLIRDAFEITKRKIINKESSGFAVVVEAWIKAWQEDV